MGIKDLKKIIKKHASKGIFDVSLSNSKVAIDSSILLYKYRYLNKSDNFHILGFLTKVIELLENEISPIFVFDGPPPEAKKSVLDNRIKLKNETIEKINELIAKRDNFQLENFIDSDSENESEIENVKEAKKINKEIKKLQKNLLIIKKIHSDQVIELLESLGISFLRGISEAEETCAFLQKKGFVDYVITEDTDALTFGAENVIFSSNKNYNLTIILSELTLNYSEFIDFCILCGCDYTCTIPKIGSVTALKLIKKHRSIENIIKYEKYNIPELFEYQLARDLFKQNNNYQVDIKLNIPDKNKLNEILLKNDIPDFFIKKINYLIFKKKTFDFLKEIN